GLLLALTASSGSSARSAASRRSTSSALPAGSLLTWVVTGSATGPAGATTWVGTNGWRTTVGRLPSSSDGACSQGLAKNRNSLSSDSSRVNRPSLSAGWLTDAPST